MKIAILGGGFTGLTAAYYLAKKNHKVTVFEKEKNLGGMASGFKADNWDWYLERTYHHLFTNDQDILGLAKETGFNDFIYKTPETASLYTVRKIDSVTSFPPTSAHNLRAVWSPSPRATYFSNNLTENYRIIPLDTPQDLLRFPLLNFPEKIRAGLVLAFLKFSPFLSLYEKETAYDFLRKSMGARAWEVLWQELFRKKFGKYAEKILTSFFWARIKKRTKQLVYVEGGFQALINHLEKVTEKRGVTIKKEIQIMKVESRGGKFLLSFCHPDRSPPNRRSSGGTPFEKIKRDFSANARNDRESFDEFDIVISTLPTPITARIGERLFSNDYLSRLKKIKYLSAINLILETDSTVLDKTYWLNICVSDNPMMIVAQHTNFMDKKYYNNKHILYIGNYIDEDDKLLTMNKTKVLDYYILYLKTISNQQLTINNSFLFKTPFGQPIFDREFLKNKPDFVTPVKNFYIANLDMTYPYDRGTNYAVLLGKKVSQLI